MVERREGDLFTSKFGTVHAIGLTCLELKVDTVVTDSLLTKMVKEVDVKTRKI
jgi:hypothetical protein